MWTSLVVGSFLPLLALTDNFYNNDVLATADAVADITTFLHWSDALFVYDESLCKFGMTMLFVLCLLYTSPSPRDSL